MIVVAACTMLWYIPVIVVTALVHIFVDRWRAIGMKSYLPLYTIGFMIFLGTLALMPYLVRFRFSIPHYLIACGFVLLALGLTFLFWSYKTLSFKALAWVNELRRIDSQVSQPVREGPYKFCRHPVYSAAFAIMLSVFLISGVASLIIPSIMLAALVAFEEKELRRRFGERYTEYAKDAPIILWPRILRSKWSQRES